MGQRNPGQLLEDYAGQDLNGNGIGDIQYKIDAKNEDDYPLIQPPSPP